MSVTTRAAVGLAAVLALRAAPLAAPTPAPRAHQPRPARSFETGQSLDKLRKLAGAIHNYHDLHDHFPRDIRDRDGKLLLSWRVAILPYLDLDFLHAQFKFDEPWDGPNNKKLAAFMPDVFRASVQDRRANETYYQAVSGPGAFFDPGEKVTFLGITDGTSATLMLVEAGPPVPWTKPADVPFDPDRDPPELAGPFTDALHVAVADGTAFRMKPKPGPDLWRAFITRAGGEVLELKNLRAAPARPATEEEKKDLARTRDWAQSVLRDATGAADDRFRVEEALRKLGPVPYPDPKKIETQEELREAFKPIEERRWADVHEFYRLIEILEEKDPKAAEAIRKARADRIRKQEAAGDKK
jgi:hypothetical protein